MNDNNLWGHLEVFEFPIQNPEIYGAKKKDPKTTPPSYHDYFLQMDSIKEVDLFERSGPINSESPSCPNSPDLQADTNLASCDNLLFTYSSLPNVRERLNSYQPDSNKINKFKQELEKIFNSGELINLASECFDLPEVNFEAYFDKSNQQKITTLNQNLVAPSLIQDFEKVFNDYFYLVWGELTEYDSDLGLNIANMTSMQLSTPKSYSVYAVKKTVPKDNKIACFGDLHSSVHTLLRSLLRLVKMQYLDTNYKLVPNFHIIFLGDLIDRGIYGIEVFYIIMKLKITNPDQVHICRGNHESYTTSYNYGFVEEVLCSISEQKEKCQLDHFETASKYTRITPRFTEISRSWLFLPSAIFLNLGDDQYIQFCHGGFYRNYEKIRNFLQNDSVFLKIKPNEYTDDFMWSDFRCGKIERKNFVDKVLGFQNKIRGAGQIYDAFETLRYCQETGIVAVIRGHQDLYNNTKLITYLPTCKDPVAWEDEYKLRPSVFSGLIANRGENFSISLPIPKISNIEEGFNKHYPPVYTFTTAVSPRMIDSDGFGILKLISSQTGSGLTKWDKYEKARIRYLKRYLALKNN